ncbi:hypothetical protein L195_g008141, partial [Trifolium pratense]
GYVYIAPSAGPRPLMAFNGHQVAAGKQLESYNEQLMLIIPVTTVTIRVGIVTVGGSSVCVERPCIRACSEVVARGPLVFELLIPVQNSAQ